MRAEAADLSVKGEVETITNEYFRYTWSVFVYFIQPAFDSVKTPLISDVIDKEYSLCSS